MNLLVRAGDGALQVHPMAAGLSRLGLLLATSSDPAELADSANLVRPGRSWRLHRRWRPVESMSWSPGGIRTVVRSSSLSWSGCLPAILSRLLNCARRRAL